MATKKYITLDNLSTFLGVLKDKFAAIGHAHDDLYYTESEIDNKLSALADGHYTEAEIDEKLDGKANVVHSHSYNELSDKPTIPSIDGLATTLYVDEKISTKADSTHNHDDIYDVKGAASDALIDAKSYTDTKTFNLASTTIVDNKISAHDTSSSAHNDIRVLITELTTKLNNFLDVDDTTTDQLSEVLTLINNNKGTLESLTSSKVNVSDIVNNLTTSSASKVLSAAQGVAIKSLIDALQSELDSHTHAIADVSGLQSALDGKAASSHGTHVSYSTTAPVMDGTASVGSASTVARSDHKHPTDTSRASKSEFEGHTADSIVHITSTERTNWNAAKTHSDSSHAPSDAEKNQNAFSNVKVGTTTIAADTTTDTLTLVGSNVTITPDATNDKVTFSVADGTTSAKGVVQLTNSTSSTSTTTAATPSSVKSAYDLANTAKSAAATAQATADSKANASHGNHVPATQTANNAIFLRNDNTWATVTPANIGAVPTSRTVNGKALSGNISLTASDIGVVDWFGSATSIPADSDLDTYTTIGKYSAVNDATVKTLVNCPVTSNFVLYVYKRASSSVNQLIMSRTGIHMRGNNSPGTWSAWKASLNADSDGGALAITKGGTGATNGATGLANLFAAGNTVLSSYQYGDTLPSSASEGTMFFKKATGTVADIDTNLVSELMLTMYPVDSIYMSTSSTSPAELFGGTWMRITDRFLLAASDTYTAGSTGGATTNTHRHWQTVGFDGEGFYSILGVEYSDSQVFTASTRGNVGIASANNYSTRTDATLHQTIDIMPPYLVVYMWKRTA